MYSFYGYGLGSGVDDDKKSVAITMMIMALVAGIVCIAPSSTASPFTNSASAPRGEHGHGGEQIRFLLARSLMGPIV